MEAKETLNKILLFTCILGLIAFGIGVFFTKDILGWALGIIVGTLVSVLKVFLLERTLNKAVDMSPEDAKNYTRSRYTFRMVLRILVLVASIKIHFIDVIGVIVGLLLVQPAVYIVNFINRGKK